MLPLALTLLAASAILLALALRGRTIVRGLFCRRCKFDLQGLDLTTTPTCPECGRDLAPPRATTVSLRRRSYIGLVAAALLALAATVPLAASIPSARTYMLPHLPDPALTALDRLGLQGTHPEILARLQDPARPRTPALASLLDDALAAVEQEPDQAPRPDLERIASGLHGDKLDEPQLTRLLGAMYSAEYDLRSAPLPDKAAVPYMVKIATPIDLASIAASLGLPPLMRYEVTIGHTKEISHDLQRTAWTRVPGGVAQSKDWHAGSSNLWNFRSGIATELLSGSDFTTGARVRWNQNIRLTDKSSGSLVATIRMTHEQEVRPSGAADHGVTLYEDPATLSELAASVSVSRVIVPDAPLTTGGLMFLDSLFQIQSERPSVDAVAFRVFVLESDGTRTAVAGFTFNQSAPDKQTWHSYGALARPTGDDTPTWNARFARWAAAGTVDILLVPDPWLAWENFFPDRLLAGELIVRDVPVEAVPPLVPGEFQSPSHTGHAAEVHHPIINPSTDKTAPASGTRADQQASPTP